MQVQEGSSLRITGLCCGSGYTIEEEFTSDGYVWGWAFYMSGKLQFSLSKTSFDNWSSPADRKLTFLRLGHKVAEICTVVYLLILEKSPGDGEKYIRVGFTQVSMWTWERMNLEFWSVQSVTII